MTPEQRHSVTITINSERHVLMPGTVYVVGRSAGVDFHTEDPRTSRRHATIHFETSGWTLTNHGSNGTFHDGRRVDTVRLESGRRILLGDGRDGVEIAVVEVDPEQRAEVQRTSSAPGRAPTSVHRLAADIVTIGREHDNSVVVDDLLVSRHHATIEHSRAGAAILTDLDSANGTFVNGKRTDRREIGNDDVIGIGRSLFRLHGSVLEEYFDDGAVSFVARGLGVTTKQQNVLLDDVSFELGQRSFLAVVGPTGAGKSTLLNALTGFRPASRGFVRYDDRDLYENYAELRQRIGYVPQDDILHPQLTVARALGYAAELRFSRDVTAVERSRRIDEVLADLGLTAHAEKRISSLSGGQRKRTSVALELLSKPSLLFLDELTSGLDPGYDKSVMLMLRRLADDGRSIIVVTHNVAQIELCDKLLVLAPRGSLAYFGPPDRALEYFECEDFPDLFTTLERETEVDWSARFRAMSSDSSSANSFQPSSESHTDRNPPDAGRAQQSVWTQFLVLSRRYLAVIAADRQYSAFLVALPLVLSLFAHAVPGSAGLSVQSAAEAGSNQPRLLLILLVIGGALMGCSASLREIVKEQAIYRREHAIGMSRAAYMASKLVVLTVIVGLQAIVLAIFGVLGLPGPDNATTFAPASFEIAVAVIAVTVASMAIGLCISSAIDNADRGMPLMVLVIMAQLILCGGLFPIIDRAPLTQVSWLAPSRWAYSMGASTMDLQSLQPPLDVVDPLWRSSVYVWSADLGASMALTAIFVASTALSLKRLDPKKRAL